MIDDAGAAPAAAERARLLHINYLPAAMGLQPDPEIFVNNPAGKPLPGEAAVYSEAKGIDDPRGRLSNRRRDAHDRVAADSDVASVPGAARAVDDAAVSEQQIVRLALSGWDPGKCKDHKCSDAEDNQLAHLMKSPIFSQRCQTVTAVAHPMRQSNFITTEVVRKGLLNSARSPAFFPGIKKSRAESGL